MGDIESLNYLRILYNGLNSNYLLLTIRKIIYLFDCSNFYPFLNKIKSYLILLFKTKIIDFINIYNSYLDF